MLTQVPSPTQSLMQWTGAEPTSGNSSLPVQRMDCDTTGYRHVGKEWMKQIRREKQERVAEGADWRRSVMPWTPLRRAVTNSRRRETEYHASATVARPSMAVVVPKALAEETSQPVAIPSVCGQQYVDFCTVRSQESTSRATDYNPKWSVHKVLAPLT